MICTHYFHEMDETVKKDFPKYKGAKYEDDEITLKFESDDGVRISLTFDEEELSTALEDSLKVMLGKLVRD